VVRHRIELSTFRFSGWQTTRLKTIAGSFWKWSCRWGREYAAAVWEYITHRQAGP